MKLVASAIVMNTPRERLRYLAKVEETIRKVPKSEGQQEFERKYATQIPVLLRRIRRCKVRPAILSFGWKVVNRKVHANMVGGAAAHGKRPCEWCGHRLTTRHILNGECGHIREIQGHYEALLRAPHLKQAIRNELTHVWALWKAWCRMVHDSEEKTPNTFVCLYREFKCLRKPIPLLGVNKGCDFLAVRQYP